MSGEKQFLPQRRNSVAIPLVVAVLVAAATARSVHRLAPPEFVRAPLLQSHAPVALLSTNGPIGYVDRVRIGTAPPVPVPNEGGIDVVAGSRITLFGWAAASTRPAQLPRQIVVIVEGRPVSGTARVEARPDVVNAYNSQGLLNAGYRITFKAPLKPGKYAVQVEAEGEKHTFRVGGPLTVLVR